MRYQWYLNNVKDIPMNRVNVTRESDCIAARTYLSKPVPKLTISDESGLNDDLYAKRLLKQMLAQLEHSLPESFHIVQLHYDSDPKGYTESIGVLLLVPAEEASNRLAMRNHAIADRLTNKAAAEVFNYDPDCNGVVLSTYGMLDDGTLVIDT